MKNKKLPPVYQNPQSEGSSFFWEGHNKNSTAIILFHGFTATTIEVKPLAKFFNRQGFTVAGPLLPGHGVSPEELNKTNYSDWINSAETAYHQVRERYKNVFIAGESMGGLCTLWLASKFAEIKGIMLFAPALIIPGLWQSNLAWPFVKQIFKKNIDLETSWQGFNVVPMRAAAQLNQYQRIIKKRLSKITTPSLIFQGKLDKTIDPMSSVIALEGISSVEKELVWLNESTHCILLDQQINIVESLCLEFIQNRIT